MPDKLKKRIALFYAAGVLNLLIGAYILLAGRSFLPEDKITMLMLFFLGFAAVDFWMPVMLKKKGAREQEKLEQQGGAKDASPPQT